MNIRNDRSFGDSDESYPGLPRSRKAFLTRIRSLGDVDGLVRPVAGHGVALWQLPFASWGVGTSRSSVTSF